MRDTLFTAHKSVEECPQCGHFLQLRRGKKGLFLGCSQYPQCDYLRPLQSQTLGEVLKILPEQCPECEHPLVLRRGQFGLFIGCSNYPECHFIVSNEPEKNDYQPVSCPACKQGKLMAKRGARGKLFFACDHYPQCRFNVAQQPIAKACPLCHFPLVYIKKMTDQQISYQCLNKSCKHTFYESNE